MRPVWIVAAETVTALGDTLEASWRRLLAGESGIRPVRRFATDGYICRHAAEIDGLAAQDEASGVRPLLDRLLHDFGPVPADAAALTATTKWGIDALERQRRGATAHEEDLLAGGLPQAIGRRFGLSTPGLNINAACASSTIALARGAAMIAHGQSETVLVCCVDLVSEFVFSGFSALKGLSAEPCRPFDRRRSGLTLGEGAAALLLMAPERARREGRAPLGAILGWGVAGDAHHITAPARDGCGLIQAVRGALRQADLPPAAVAAINAHGTGTIYNDAMELTAFQQIFGRTLPIHSVKGALGHTLGAAGGIETALALKSLQETILPPTTGFAEAEENAAGWVSAEAVPLPGEFLLTTNSGFGGINAALLLTMAGGEG
ncbi:MAG: beta-ketoacyl-[acyl-carrier-protein] synthase family protein [Desulfuromonadales bacterium]